MSMWWTVWSPSSRDWGNSRPMPRGRWRCRSAPLAAEANGLESIYTAMVVGLRDYVGKNRFPGVVIGLWAGWRMVRRAPRRLREP